MKPLVSILIPAYNAEKWIKDTIQSAFAQTWPNKEIIIVNDGSNDSTLKVARQFESKILKVIDQPNRGASNARNRALAKSQGDFIQWLDADDLLAPDKISIQLTGVNNSPETRVLNSSAWGRFYFRPQKARFSPSILWQDLSPVDWLIKSFERGCWMHPSSWLVSRKIADLVGPWNERLIKNQDGEYFCRVVAASKFVKFYPKALCYYRIGNTGSLSWGRSEKALESLSFANNLCVDHLLSIENSEITRKACIDFLYREISRIYPATSSEIIEDNYRRIIELGGNIIQPYETRKFYWIRKVLGWKRARSLKNWCWGKTESIRMKWDKLLNLIA